MLIYACSPLKSRQQFPAVNSPFTVTITVKNMGNITVDGGELEVWKDRATLPTCGDTGDTFGIIGQLAAGESKTLTATLRADSAGSKLLRIFIDSQCTTIESNDRNNHTGKRYFVR